MDGEGGPDYVTGEFDATAELATLGGCAAQCAADGYQYMGLTWGMNCMCDNVYDSMGEANATVPRNESCYSTDGSMTPLLDFPGSPCGVATAMSNIDVATGAVNSTSCTEQLCYYDPGTEADDGCDVPCVGDSAHDAYCAGSADSSHDEKTACGEVTALEDNAACSAVINCVYTPLYAPEEEDRTRCGGGLKLSVYDTGLGGAFDATDGYRGCYNDHLGAWAMLGGQDDYAMDATFTVLHGHKNAAILSLFLGAPFGIYQCIFAGLFCLTMQRIYQCLGLLLVHQAILRPHRHHWGGRAAVLRRRRVVQHHRPPEHMHRR